jgi:hypothetical protein
MSGFLGLFMALGVTAALLFGITAVGEAAIDDTRAATAADASALAGAAAGQDAAIEAAALNGAELVLFSRRGAITSVVVRVGRASVRAYAERLLVPA